MGEWNENVIYCFCFFSEELNDVVNQSLLKELQEERAEKVCVCLPASSIICLWQLILYLKNTDKIHLLSFLIHVQTKTMQKLSDTLKR